MTSKEDLYWLVGLLEGEGCFSWNGSPLITLAMTDLDVIEKARDILLPNRKIYRKERPEKKRKIIYAFTVSGENAIEWMRVLQPLMFLRRREKIAQILDIWDNKKPIEPRGLERAVCAAGHDLTDPKSYTLQDTTKHCKICANERANKNYHKKGGYEYVVKRKTIKALAIARNISIEEAEAIMASLMNGSSEGTKQ
jgi:hypothetical protein